MFAEKFRILESPEYTSEPEIERKGTWYDLNRF